MIIIWCVVIAVALLIEFLTYDMITLWFTAGAIPALIMAACRVDWPWQLLVFFVVSLVCIIFLRKVMKTLIRGKTIPTNADANIGVKVKLASDVVNGRSTINLNDTVWTVECDDEMKMGERVEIIAINGNKFKVKKIEGGSKQ